MTHQELSPALEKYSSQVRVVRRQVPLRSIHPHAMDAAKAACCGEKLGKEAQMAEALFSAPVEDLTPEGCERIASGLGIDPGAFRACFADAATSARVEAEIADFKSSGGRSLPTIWVEDTKFIGAQDRETLERAIERAIEAKKRHKTQNG
jgi:predicted DsbA family dithiol-disulfide isomerase